ncbi:MAG: hypothetical protein ACREOJ_21000 [Gemmatimonadaceae bacterium]
MGIIKIALIDDHGNDEVEVEGDTHLLDPILPQFQDDSFQCLLFIDPFGDTVFNRLQLQCLIHEWDAVLGVALDGPAHTIVEQVGGLIRKGAAEPHTYLKVFGD